MVTTSKYNQLPQHWKDQIQEIIKKISGKSWIADILIEDSELKSYEFKITVMKYNTKKGWATIGYVRNDIFRGGIWRLTYKPRLLSGEKNEAGRTGAYS